MSHSGMRRFRAALPVLLILLGGCSATQVETRAGLPAPLVDRLPLRVGIYYPREFREYVHREKRQNIDYEITGKIMVEKGMVRKVPFNHRGTVDFARAAQK
mgnify:CR=1 FL=1